EALAQVRDQVAEMERGRRRAMVERGEVGGVGLFDRGAPRGALERRELPHARQERGRVCDDRYVGLVDASELAAVRVDVHERVGCARRLERRIAARRNLAEPGAERDEDV